MKSSPANNKHQLKQATMPYASRRPERRVALESSKLGLTSSLFQGGALNSQVTDSQFLNKLLGAEDSQPSHEITSVDSKTGLQVEEKVAGQNTQHTVTDQPSPSPLHHGYSLTRPCSPSRSPRKVVGITMELSKHEKGVVIGLRDAIGAEVETLMEYLQQADEFRYELISTNRYLRAENRGLTEALMEHGIEVPLPCTQYTSTPSP